jgi:hypothetical protein
LGWNAKWVTGYKGTADVNLALDRGEIEMTSGNTNDESLLRMLRTGNFAVLTLAGKPPTGAPVLPEYMNAPQITDQIAGKLDDPVAKSAFQFWLTTSSIEWFGLPPGAPKDVVEAFRQALSQAATDPKLKKGSALLDLVLTDHRNF